MKKSKAVKTMGLMALLLLVSAILLYSFLIYPRIHYYEPVTVGLRAQDKDITDITYVCGITPFNRSIPFYLKKQGEHKVQFLDYSFVKEIRVALPDTLLDKEFELTVIIGKTVLIITKNNFFSHFKSSETKAGNQTSYMLIEPAYQKNYFKVLFSILLWPLVREFLNSYMLSIIMSLTLIVFGLYNRKVVFNTFNNTLFYTGLLFKLLILCCINVFIWLIYSEVVLWKNNGLRFFTGYNAVLFYLLLFSMLFILIKTILHFLRIRLKTKQKIYLSMLTFFVCVSISEFVLRVFMFNANYYEQNFGYYGPSLYDNTYAHPLYVYNPDTEISYRNKEFTHYRVTNNEGLCDKDFVVAKNDSLRRILVLGDSYTEGIGVAEDKTWVKQLEKKLNAAGQKYEVLNAGISGSDPFFELYLLKNKLLTYKPDMVLLALNPTDVDDIVIRGGVERFKSGNEVVYNDAPLWEPFYACSYILRAVLHQGLGYEKNLMQRHSYEQSKKNALQLLTDLSLQFDELSLKENFSYYWVFHPDFYSVQKGSYEMLGSIIDEMKRKPMNYIDVLPEFLKEKKNDETLNDLFWPVDKHYTEKGQELMSEAVFNVFKNESNK